MPSHTLLLIRIDDRDGKLSTGRVVHRAHEAQYADPRMVLMVGQHGAIGHMPLLVYVGEVAEAGLILREVAPVKAEVTGPG
ncbi:MAG: hypothetical protein RhofKO_14630 [Rhodothermales bacterium]